MPKYPKIQQKIKNELTEHNLINEAQLTQDILDSLYVYMPFGGSHRACIDQDLAFFGLKPAIISLMQRVSFEDSVDATNNSGKYIQRLTCFPEHLAVRIRIDTDKKSN
ncbi:unnamed protein product [Adineta steineri]|uniref:Uncharacterized protein n=1 Tax=Adineta steineri TaxID=433720 RepID=A0A813VGK4_9BILA|nr:unnamed protein product [Adineta steineri]CAF1172337.1 unnamed protein product [Adineta steineri]